MARRLRQNAMRDLNMAVVAVDPVPPKLSSRSAAPAACCSEKRRRRYHQLSRLQTIENLDPTVLSQARLDDSLRK